MSESNDANAAKSGQGNATRIVLISILVVAIAVLVLDRRARSACSDVHAEVEQMLMGDEMPSFKQVREAIKRLPDKVYRLGDGRLVEQYKWSGIVREYSLYTYIQPGVGDLDPVTAVTLNTVQDGIDLTSATELTLEEARADLEARAPALDGNPTSDDENDDASDDTSDESDENGDDDDAE